MNGERAAIWCARGSSECCYFVAVSVGQPAELLLQGKPARPKLRFPNQRPHGKNVVVQSNRDARDPAEFRTRRMPDMET